MKKLDLKLTDVARKELQTLCTKGTGAVRDLIRAQILLALERGASDGEISMVLGVERTRIWRTRKRYLEYGLSGAIHEYPRSGRPMGYDEQLEAEIVATVCSAPPVGRQRWTLALLSEVVARQCQLNPLSQRSVGRVLKKIGISLGERKCGVLGN